jgi:hypothetical protein
MSAQKHKISAPKPRRLSPERHAGAEAAGAAHDGLCDDRGPIPAFGPVATDEHGRAVMGPAEREARVAAAIRALDALDDIGDPAEQRASFEAIARGIDARRPPGQKIFTRD